MHILIMGQHFAPEDISGAILATELAQGLVKRGHDVTFVTCFPNYPRGILFPGYSNRLISKETYDGVKVIRTWSFISPKKSFWRRIFNFATFSIGAFWGGLFAEKPDVILSISPPLPLGISAWVLSKLWEVPWVLRVSDLYPDAAVVIGLIKNRLAIRFLSFVEKFLYARASCIFSISPGIKQEINHKGIPNNKIVVVPVWADPSFVLPMEKENKIRGVHRLNGKFIILYSGNIGLTSSLEDVLHAAYMLIKNDMVQFIICGEGMRKSQLENFVLKNKMGNVLFLPYQERQNYPLLLATADLGLVTINEQSSRSSLPSKVFNIMASGRPVLSIAPRESELAKLITENRCGINIPNNSPETLSNSIIELMNSPEMLTEMGKKARKLIEGKYCKKNCLDLYENLLAEITMNGQVLSYENKYEKI